MACIWLDSAARKACSVLRARLGPLGYTVRCISDLPDVIIAEWARRDGCVVFSTDRRACQEYGWVYVDPEYIKHKNKRDLATYIIKMARR